MASFQIEWKRSATKELRSLPHEVVERIIKAVDRLVEIPFPPGSRKMIGSESNYRLRVGDYRVIYSVLSSSLMIEIVRVGHRRDVYER